MRSSPRSLLNLASTYDRDHIAKNDRWNSSRVYFVQDADILPPYPKIKIFNFYMLVFSKLEDVIYFCSSWLAFSCERSKVARGTLEPADEQRCPTLHIATKWSRPWILYNRAFTLPYNTSQRFHGSVLQDVWFSVSSRHRLDINLLKNRYKPLIRNITLFLGKNINIPRRWLTYFNYIYHKICIRSCTLRGRP